MTPVDLNLFRRLRTVLPLIVWATLFIQPAVAYPQDAQVEAKSSRKWAVILVGIPGDEDHAVTFRTTADQIHQWLIESLQFPSAHVLRLPSSALNAPSLTAEQIRTTLADLSHKLEPDDSLWIFSLGHGHYDGKQAWFHVAGRDPSSDDFGRWVNEVPCREQVIWLMQPSSGWFVKPLSRPGRIIVTATAADEEANETEFPSAFATVAMLPPGDLDTNHDLSVSVSELYSAVVREVLQRFKSDNRLPTEHPQLDDNGDGVGTEEISATSVTSSSTANKPGKKKLDGQLAQETIVPYRLVKEDKAP